MTKGLYVLGTKPYEEIYGASERQDIGQLVDIYAPPQTSESVLQNPSLLREAEVIFSGWGGPKLDRDFLAAAPNLKAVFYGAGSIKGIVTEEFWERSILICSAWAANAVPVSEFTLAQILISLKRGWYFVQTVKEHKAYPVVRSVSGAYGATVGIVSLGMIGRRVVELLRPFDLNIVAFDPFVSTEEAEALGVRLCSLDEVFQTADVVSLHTPWLKETEGMIKGRHFRLMKEGATFINTARGAVVNEPEMIEALQDRPDLWAVLDVTWPEPPRPESPLYFLPNVVLTPHIAGSMGKECNRMGRYMVEELKRYIAGVPLKWAISKEKASIMA